MAPDDDATLLDGIRKRDEAAFTALVGRYHTALVRLARTFVRDATLAEEVAQETWLAVLEGIDGYEARGTLKAWIFRILANRARTRAVREGRTVNFSAVVAGEDAPAVDPARFNGRGMWSHPPDAWIQKTPDEIALSSELGGRIREAIDALPERLRAIVIMRDVEGLTAEDVCTILEVSETNQRVLLHRGRSRLRAALEPYLTDRGRPSC